jgi:hypothetical protein
MPKQPAGIFDDEDLDISGFERKTEAPAKPEPAIIAAAEAQNFQSREPKPKPVKAAPARRGKWKTGRNVPFAVKVSQPCNDGFYRIADEHDWTMGLTLEKALAALERELALEKTGKAS